MRRVVRSRRCRSASSRRSNGINIGALGKLCPDHRGVLDQVLFAEIDLATAGRNASGRADEKQAVAVAIDRLACACATLALHFGLAFGPTI
jgi:hypothetical protein